MCVLRPPHGAYITLVLQQIEQLVECGQVSGLIRCGQHNDDISIHISVKGQFFRKLKQRHAHAVNTVIHTCMGDNHAVCNHDEPFIRFHHINGFFNIIPVNKTIVQQRR